MTDISKTIAPKSDQLNADDLISGPITIKVTGVSLKGGDQPIAINYEGDGGKPWMPCKSMRRVLVHVWGSDGASYAGRSVTIFRDEKVVFGGAPVGGVRISHMSHIDKPVTLALTVTRANRKPFTVQPLAVSRTAAAPSPAEDMSALEGMAMAEAQKGTAHLRVWWKDSLTPAQRTHLKPMVQNINAAGKAADEVMAGDPFGLAPIPREDFDLLLADLSSCYEQKEYQGFLHRNAERIRKVVTPEFEAEWLKIMQAKEKEFSPSTTAKNQEETRA